MLYFSSAKEYSIWPKGIKMNLWLINDAISLLIHVVRCIIAKGHKNTHFSKEGQPEWPFPAKEFWRKLALFSDIFPQNNLEAMRCKLTRFHALETEEDWWDPKKQDIWANICFRNWICLRGRAVKDVCYETLEVPSSNPGAGLNLW